MWNGAYICYKFSDLHIEGQSYTRIATIALFFSAITLYNSKTMQLHAETEITLFDITNTQNPTTLRLTTSVHSKLWHLNVHYYYY